MLESMTASIDLESKANKIDFDVNMNVRNPLEVSNLNVYGHQLQDKVKDIQNDISRY
jgi:hypothetical protein